MGLNTFYTWVIHLMIIIAIISMFYINLSLVFKVKSTGVMILRALAFSGGVLIFIGSYATGVDMPGLVLDSTTFGGVIGHQFFQYIMPALIGSFTSWILIRLMLNKTHSKKIIYLYIMTSTFIIMIFSHMYIEGGFKIQESESLNSTLKTNLSFVIGMIISILVQMNPDDISENSSSNGNDEPSWKDKV